MKTNHGFKRVIRKQKGKVKNGENLIRRVARKNKNFSKIEGTLFFI
jgi:hypothetical protein